MLEVDNGLKPLLRNNDNPPFPPSHLMILPPQSNLIMERTPPTSQSRLSPILLPQPSTSPKIHSATPPTFIFPPGFPGSPTMMAMQSPLLMSHMAMTSPPLSNDLPNVFAGLTAGYNGLLGPMQQISMPQQAHSNILVVPSDLPASGPTVWVLVRWGALPQIFMFPFSTELAYISIVEMMEWWKTRLSTNRH